MRKIFLTIGGVAIIIVLAMAILFFAKVFYFDNTSNSLRGTIYDCETGETLADATVNITGENTLIDILTFHWDSSTRSKNAVSGQDGKFSINTNGGIGGVYTTRDGYLRDQEYGLDGEVRIGLLKERFKGESGGTNMCRRCSETNLVNGIIVTDYTKTYDDLCPRVSSPQL